MAIETVGIIGAGTMGNGIAQACAVAGLKVVMVDISQQAVDKGLATVAGSLDRLLKKEKIAEADKQAALARIQGGTSYEAFKAAQLVIEAATENEELKFKILKLAEPQATARPAESQVARQSATAQLAVTRASPATAA